MKIKKEIDSGLLESYVMGIATEEEIEKVLSLKAQSAEFKSALDKLELDMEALAQSMAVEPPKGIFKKIEAEINEIQIREQHLKKIQDYDFEDRRNNKKEKQDRYIEVESESNQMRINKAWRWVFAAVFILSKIFLAAAIYFYLANKQAQEQIIELKTELKQSIVR